MIAKTESPVVRATRSGAGTVKAVPDIINNCLILIRSKRWAHVSHSHDPSDPCVQYHSRALATSYRTTVGR